MNMAKAHAKAIQIVPVKTQCRAVHRLSGTVHFKLIQRFSLAFCSQMLPMSKALYRPILVV